MPVFQFLCQTQLQVFIRYRLARRKKVGGALPCSNWNMTFPAPMFTSSVPAFFGWCRFFHFTHQHRHSHGTIGPFVVNLSHALYTYTPVYVERFRIVHRESHWKCNMTEVCLEMTRLQTVSSSRFWPIPAGPCFLCNVSTNQDTQKGWLSEWPGEIKHLFR